MSKKVGHYAYALLFGFSFLAIIGTFMFSADQVTPNSDQKIGSDLSNVYSDGVSGYQDTERSLQQVTYEGGAFSLPEDRLVETRGITQGNVIGSDSPATVKESITQFTQKVATPGVLITLLISAIVLGSVIVLVRLIRGDSAS